MPAFRDRTSWYLGLSAYWFAASYKWFILLQIVIPGQVQEIVPSAKSAYWGAIFGAGAIWAIFGPSIFGYWSDRMHRKGRPERRLFLSVGAGLTVIALFTLFRADSLLLLAVGYLLLQISDDVGTGPYSASIPELVPEEHRSRASAIMGMLNAGGQIGTVIAAKLLNSVELIYLGIAVVNVLCASWTISTLRDAEPHASPERPDEPRSSIGGFFRGWAKPWRDSDFRWVWFTRMLNALGLYLVQPYLLYYIQDRVAGPAGTVRFLTLELSPTDATMGLVLLISLTAIVGSILASGVSERLGRKRTVQRSALLIAAGLIPVALFPNFHLLAAIAVIFGIGYGMYLAADWALASDVMPDRAELAKDMGVWQSSVTSVQVVAGAFGTVIFLLNRNWPGAGYSAAFLVAAGAFYLSAHLVRMVRGST